MNREDRLRAYEAFFVKSQAGQEFMQELDQMIATAHESAEEDPSFARDFTQEARGVRKVKDHIIGAMTGIKKGQPIAD